MLFEYARNLTFFYHSIAILTLALLVISLFVDSRKTRANNLGSLNCFIFYSSIHYFLEVFLKNASLYFVLDFFSKFAIFKIPSTVATLLLTIVIADFMYYVKHRAQHRYSILWTEHSVHHSSTEFNFLISFRMCLYSSLLTFPFLLPEVLLGFTPLQVLVGYRTVTLFQWGIHTEKLNQLPILDKFLNTPFNHRPHHQLAHSVRSCNYGGITILWDRVFGTFVKKDVTGPYGDPLNLNSNHFFEVNFYFWRFIFQGMKNRSGIKEKLFVLFEEPTKLAEEFDPNLIKSTRRNKL